MLIIYAYSFTVMHFMPLFLESENTVISHVFLLLETHYGTCFVVSCKCLCRVL